MAQPVWVLSVDLQTKTATFQSGMADAAKTARGAFNDIKTGAGEMSTETGYKMSEARHGVMLLGEEFGVHMPRAITTFIAGLGPVGAAMEAAFPFLAILVGATLLLEHLAKMREESAKLAEDQTRLGTAANNALGSLDQKLLQAGERADELSGNHLAALHKKLLEIDHASLEDLVHSLDVVAKAADVVFADLKGHWYTFGVGSAGAQHALTQFKTEYESLLSQGKDKEASDLLAGTLKSAQRILEVQKQQAAEAGKAGKEGPGRSAEDAEAARLELQKAGVGFTEKEVQAQQSLVAALNAQVSAERKVSELKALQSENARTQTGSTISGEANAALVAQMNAERKAQDEEEKLRSESYRKAVKDAQDKERETIAATRDGSRERLQAIDAALSEEKKWGREDLDFTRALNLEKTNLVRRMVEEQDRLQARLRADAARIAAEHELQMGQLAIAADKEHSELMLAAQRATIERRIAAEIGFENREYALRMTAYSHEIAALDKNGKDYENKLKAIQNRQEELTRQHENKVTQIKNTAERQRDAEALAAEDRVNNTIASGLSSTLMRHQSFAAMMASIGDQIASSLIAASIKYMLIQDQEKRHDAATAARKAFIAGWHFPFPVNIVMAPLLGATAFSMAMGFAEGGLVPGFGNSDTVPAMLTPGEHVADKSLTEGLRQMVASGGNRTHVTMHYRPTYHVQTIDGSGIRDVLRKHNEEFSRHFQKEVRKLNR